MKGEQGGSIGMLGGGGGVMKRNVLYLSGGKCWWMWKANYVLIPQLYRQGCKVWSHTCSNGRACTQTFRKCSHPHDSSQQCVKVNRRGGGGGCSSSSAVGIVINGLAWLWLWRRGFPLREGAREDGRKREGEQRLQGSVAAAPAASRVYWLRERHFKTQSTFLVSLNGIEAKGSHCSLPPLEILQWSLLLRLLQRRSRILQLGLLRLLFLFLSFSFSSCGEVSKDECSLLTCGFRCFVGRLLRSLEVCCF